MLQTSMISLEGDSDLRIVIVGAAAGPGLVRVTSEAKGGRKLEAPSRVVWAFKRCMVASCTTWGGCMHVYYLHPACCGVNGSVVRVGVGLASATFLFTQAAFCDT